MFSKLALLAFVAPLVSALTLEIPENPTSAGQITIKWTSAPGDPDTWSFELINTAFNNAFAIANNVDPAPQQLTLTLPPVPVGSGYTLEAVDIGDISKVFATTGSFSIGASTASTTPLSTSTGRTSQTGSQTGSQTSSPSSALSPSTSATPTAPSNIVTQSPATSATSPPPSPTPSNGAALSSRVVAPAAVLLSGLAGAAMIAL